MRRAGADNVDHVDWDFVTVKMTARRGDWRWLERRTVRLARPYEATKADHERLFRTDRSLEDIVGALEQQTSIQSPEEAYETS